MKSGTIVLVFSAAVVVAGIAYAFVRDCAIAREEEAAVPERPDGSRRFVHVDELAAKPERFEGEIAVRAVVAAVRESEAVFSVIDAREFESCGVLTCAANYLPVEFEGTLPKPRTVIEMTGQVVPTDKGLVLKASRVDAVP